MDGPKFPAISSGGCSITVKIILTDDRGNIMVVFEKEQFKSRNGLNFFKKSGCGLSGGGIRMDRGEDVLSGAARELLEELGGIADIDHDPDHWVEVPTSLTHKVVFLRATNFRKIQKPIDPDIIGSRWVPWKAFYGQVLFEGKMYKAYARHVEVVHEVLYQESLQNS